MGFDPVDIGREGHSGLLRLVLRRPSLWPEAVRAWMAMRSRGRLSPSRAYLRWRNYTAYGDYLATPGAQDLFKYLEWRRGMRKVRKWERVA